MRNAAIPLNRQQHKAIKQVRLLFLSEVHPDELERDQITRLVYGDYDDDGFKADCIFVFGARNPVRADKAAELYQAGRAPYIMLTGGTRPLDKQPQAILLRDRLLSLGVPPTAILLECESIDTFENVLYSLIELKRSVGLGAFKKFLVVSVPWHARRCLLTLRTYTPSWMSFNFCSADYFDHQRDNWWKVAEVERLVKGEAKKLCECVRNGWLLDEEITI